jgi:hypothetical protein
VRTSVTACVLGALGALVGGWLVARWCLGVVLIVESGLGVAWGVLRDDGREPAAVRVPGQGLTLAQVLEKARSS